MSIPNYEGDGAIPSNGITGVSLLDKSFPAGKLSQIGNPDQPHATMVTPFVISVDVTSASAAVAVIAVAPFAFKVIDVIVNCIGNNGAGTVVLKNGTNAITNAIACAAVGVSASATTIDATYSSVAAGGALNITKNGAGDTGIVYVYCERVLA